MWPAWLASLCLGVACMYISSDVAVAIPGAININETVGIFKHCVPGECGCHLKVMHLLLRININELESDNMCRLFPVA